MKTKAKQTKKKQTIPNEPETAVLSSFGDFGCPFDEPEIKRVLHKKLAKQEADKVTKLLRIAVRAIERNIGKPRGRVFAEMVVETSADAFEGTVRMAAMPNPFPRLMLPFVKSYVREKAKR